jgi:hypothetical protein
MTAATTLSIYIARRFTGAVIAMLFALCGLVAIFDFIELLRRSAYEARRDVRPGQRDRGLRCPTSQCRSCRSPCCSRHPVLLAPDAISDWSLPVRPASRRGNS